MVKMEKTYQLLERGESEHHTKIQRYEGIIETFSA